MWNVVESAVGVVSSRFVCVWWPQRHLNVANFRALRTYPSTCLPVRRLGIREKSVGTRWGRVEFMASTRKSPVVTVQADLRRRVAEVTDVLDAGLDRIRRLARRCSDAVTSVSSVVASPDARAKIALDRWFGDGTNPSTHPAQPTTTTTTTTTQQSAMQRTQLPARRRRFPNPKRKGDGDGDGDGDKKGNATGRTTTTKEDLGTATWVFLHTLAAQYPDRPSPRQKRDAKNLIDIMTRLYPCGECAEHFQEIVRASPPDVGSGDGLARWMCEAHNAVNRSLGKPVFNCGFVRGRWRGLEDDGCDGGGPGRPGGRGCKLRSY